MSTHKHQWNVIRTFVSEGKPKVMQRLEPVAIGSDEKPKVKMWLDARQEYVLYHCVCGKRKEVELQSTLGDKE